MNLPADVPVMPIDLDSFTDIDETEAIRIQGGNKDQFMRKLIEFDSRILDASMQVITKGMRDKDLGTIK